MRGQQERTGPLFSYISTEDRIPTTHPLRQVRRLADQALDRLNPHFCWIYPEGGRPSIPPEKLLLALLLQAICGIRSARLLIQQLNYNLLFRWFIGLNPYDPVWHSTTSAKTRVRRFIGQAEECLLDTAQQEWLAKRGLGHKGRDQPRCG